MTQLIQLGEQRAYFYPFFIDSDNNITLVFCMILFVCVENKGTMAHEIMHTLGFYHEHARTDRDDNIYISFLNIKVI
jgi:hypothetical protein